MNKFDKWVKKGMRKGDNFKELSAYMVENYTQGLDTDESKAFFEDVMGKSLAIGAEAIKGKHLLTGITLGALGTGLAFVTGKVIKNIREKEYAVQLRNVHGKEAFIFIFATDEVKAKALVEEMVENKYGGEYSVIDITVVE